MTITTIKTERLELVPVSLDDVEALYHIAKKPESIEDYQYVPESPDVVKAWFEDDVKQQKPTWTIRHNGNIIGLIEAGVRKSGAISEPGYFVDMKHQRHGYATEALKPVVDWTFENTKVHRIEVGITAHNTGSRRVVEKLNFVLEGISRKNWPFKGKWHDSAIYSMLREEWEVRK
jgi:ribosomal-protein-alanine N-acetyltransferase